MVIVNRIKQCNQEGRNMRESCYDCTRKHLSQALVIAHELPQYAGDDKDDHLWVWVGHMAEAADQIQKAQPAIAEKIRDARLRVMDDVKMVYELDLNSFIREISEIVELESQDDDTPQPDNSVTQSE